MEPFYVPVFDEGGPGQVHGGDIVTLYNRQSGTYLVNEKAGDPHFLRIVNTTTAINSNTLWYIEGLEVRAGGECVRQDKKYRIKHVMTGRYLCVGIDGSLKVFTLCELDFNIYHIEW